MDITGISGIGDATAQRLKRHGIVSVEDVAQASIDQLAAVPGIGESRAAALRESARGMLPAPTVEEGTQAVQAPAVEEGPEVAQAPAVEEGPEVAQAPAVEDAGTDAMKDGKGKKGKKKGKGKKDKGRKKKKNRRQ